MNKPTYKVLVFDLYSTLIHIKTPRRFFVNIYKQSSNGFGVEFAQYMDMVMTKDLKLLFDMFPEEFYTLYQEHQSALEKELASVSVYHEVHKILEKLKEHYDLYLISNLATPYKQPFYDNRLQTYFKQSFFSCNLGITKPDPKIFKLVEDQVACKAHEILMIGDSLKSDIEGAKSMDWSFLRIDRSEESYGTDSLKNLKELEVLLEANRQATSAVPS